MQGRICVPGADFPPNSKFVARLGEPFRTLSNLFEPFRPLFEPFSNPFRTLFEPSSNPLRTLSNPFRTLFEPFSSPFDPLFESFSNPFEPFSNPFEYIYSLTALALGFQLAQRACAPDAQRRPVPAPAPPGPCGVGVPREPIREPRKPKEKQGFSLCGAQKRQKT